MIHRSLLRITLFVASALCAGAAGSAPPTRSAPAELTAHAAPAARTAQVQAPAKPAAAAASASERRYPTADELRALIERRVVQERRGVGIVLGVVDARGTTIVTAGKASLDGGRPLDGDTVFEIGSITKVFTGIVLADLASTGEVKLDDPVAKHLPDGVKVPSRNGRTLTLASLSTHTSGLPRMPDNFAPRDEARPYLDYTIEQLYAFLGTCELTRDVGAEQLYSNVGFGLLGHALSRAAGSDYEVLVTRRVIAPLGLASTSITLSPDQLARLAQGHDDALNPVPNWELPTFAGAGALRSTANDLLRFVAANLELVETPLAPTLKRAQERSIPYGANGEKRASLAWGDWGAGIHGTNVLWHDGGTGGYHSFAGFDPVARRGVVVLANSTFDLNDLGIHALEPRFPVQFVRTKVALDASELARYVGVYAIDATSVREVCRYRDRLFMRRTGQPLRELFAEAPGRFFNDEFRFQLEFDVDAAGKVVGLVVTQTDGTRNPAPRIERELGAGPWPVEIELASLDGLVGRYTFAPGVELTVRRDGERLLADLTGQPAFELFPSSPNDFFYLTVDATLTFERDEHGSARALVLHQGGADQRAERAP
ncbi:MAG: serine hydrolase [Planctomycetes bacterium]|nr:serine hydrolase [Planctomycetota bacterium]